MFVGYAVWSCGGSWFLSSTPTSVSYHFSSYPLLFAIPPLNFDDFGYVPPSFLSLFFLLSFRMSLEQLEFDHVNTIRRGDLKHRALSRQQS